MQIYFNTKIFIAHIISYFFNFYERITYVLLYKIQMTNEQNFT